MCKQLTLLYFTSFAQQFDVVGEKRPLDRASRTSFIHSADFLSIILHKDPDQLRYVVL